MASSSVASLGITAQRSFNDVSKSTSELASSNRFIPGEKESSVVVKTGKLYKQTEWSKQWKIRYFTMKDNALYYSRQDDYGTNVNDCFFLIPGVEVKSGPMVKIKEEKFFQFIVQHPKDSTSYFLCCQDEADREDWIQKISQISSRRDSISVTDLEGESPSSTRQPVGEGGGGKSSKPSVVVSDGSYKLAESSDAYPVNVDQTYHNIPRSFHQYVDEAVGALLASVHVDASGWQSIFEDKGVKGYQRQGGQLTVRGDIKMEHDMISVFDMIMNKDLASTVNKQIDLSETKCLLSANSHIQYMRFKRVRPTAVRDMLVLNHWRLLLSGKVVITSFSLGLIDLDEESRLMPKDETGNIVRADLIIGGYVLTPLHDGTLCQYVVQSDLKGNLPSWITSQVAKEQPRNVGNIKSYLDEKAKKENRPTPKSFPKQFLFQDLQNAAKQGDTNPVYETIKGRPELERSGSGGGSAGAGAGAVAMQKPLFAGGSNGGTAGAGAGAGAGGRGSGSSGSKGAASSGPMDTILGKFVFPTIRNAYQGVMNPDHRQRGVTIAAMMTLLLPPMLYVAAAGFPIRGFLFMAGLLISLRYILRLHLGDPFVRTSTSALSSPDGAISQLPDSRITLKFPIDIKALAVYVLKKKQDCGLNITFQHICVKAVAMALVEYKSMQGNIHFGSFYKNKTNHVNMTLSADISLNETVMIKIDDVDMKPVEYIANEVHERTRKLRADALEKKNKQVEQKSSGGVLEMVQSLLSSPILMSKFQELKVYIASDLGVSVPSLGIVAYPQGHASVMSSPTDPKRQIDEITVNTTAASAAPITVTMGGMKEFNYKFMRKETELTHETGMMISVVMDTRCASLSECNNFCATLQKFLDFPEELEK